MQRLRELSCIQVFLGADSSITVFRKPEVKASVITSKPAICGRVKTGHLSRGRDWVVFTLLTPSCPCDSEPTSPRTSCFALLREIVVGAVGTVENSAQLFFAEFSTVSIAQPPPRPLVLILTGTSRAYVG